MSAAALVGVAVLGGLVGLVVPPLAWRFATPPARLRRVAWLSPAVAAVVFVGLAAARGDDPALPVFLAVAAVGLVLAGVDLAGLRLPDPLVLAAGLTALVGLTGAALLSGDPGRLPGALAGAAVAGAAHVLLALLPGSRLGFGDVKLAVVLGLPLGWLGRDALLTGLLLPHLLHGALVLALLSTGQVNRQTLLPLGPALLTGTWLAVLLN
ncbi:prepilin peptidase [Micromonospora sp. WMMD710]|uniref:prepilin peptidase n=1 Tax=Micromonospora sp. WMMD710 TaxID=3016085 RepID=UPI0024167918|nr:prepilin peptidase [Micromonospora sp. WMMD710]MDG4761220.1 prepilin peptidase [Micromonospora sp. WMMD710]